MLSIEDITYEEYLEIVSENEESLETMLQDAEEQKEDSVQSLGAMNENYDPHMGDILTTDSTSSYGVTGHNGIVVGEGHVLHFPGPGENPEIISWEDWIDTYPSTIVHRPTDTVGSQEAAIWATNHYGGQEVDYGFNLNLYELSESYCSKLVWQAFANTSIGAEEPGIIPGYGIIVPYDVADAVNSDHVVPYDSMSDEQENQEEAA
ncbi:hypothetical protein EPH95_09545 [Salicibibacter halophilus]|uniref:Permuted papain-like amidase enzyme, YaeF/YiiX, C92 family n=1 Tax=Salicibibacter halophilus TaxID=2502791 RepID=A0A514LJB5_9BACI|nr:YiiX/YebB-like N1pC/P60 family cysteine hydrolase [Salicibibacter halophilus]QDI91391.1 hypothetical protein EPH95_09545 [Salicibibacter halophilus]